MTLGTLIATRPVMTTQDCCDRQGAAWVGASETCAFDLIGAVFERDIEPGEIVIIRRGRLRSLQPLRPVPERLCVFEHVYFARPDSVVFGSNVYETRKRLGRALAREHPAKADIVVVPSCTTNRSLWVGDMVSASNMRTKY